MKNLGKLSLLVLLIPLLAHADLSAKAVLNKVYHYKEDNNCWLASDNEQQTYCMKIAHSAKVNIASGQRLYVLAAGCRGDEQGNEFNGANWEKGLVGAFVAEEQQGKLLITYSDAKITMGSYGCPPVNESWKFVQLGNNNYWGWQGGESVHLGPGSAGSLFSIILAPCAKKSICDLTPSLIIDYDDTDSSISNTVIKSKLAFDTRQTAVNVFPLKITMTGKTKGKRVKKSWTLPFDNKKWQYTKPANWPFDELDDGVLKEYGRLNYLK